MMRQNLLNAVDAVLTGMQVNANNLGQVNPSGTLVKDDVVYEAYLFAEVVGVLQVMGAQLVPRLVNNSFAFRQGPGELHTTRRRFSYVEVLYQGRAYELHIDTKINTRFNAVPLEVDILIVSSACGHAVRSRQRHRPSYRSMRLGLEAKMHDGGIGMAEAKAFVGFCTASRCPRCVVALISSERMSGPGQEFLDNARPPLIAMGSISPRIADAQNVQNLRAWLTQELNGIL